MLHQGQRSEQRRGFHAYPRGRLRSHREFVFQFAAQLAAGRQADPAIGSGVCPRDGIQRRQGMAGAGYDADRLLAKHFIDQFLAGHPAIHAPDHHIQPAFPQAGYQVLQDTVGQRDPHIGKSLPEAGDGNRHEAGRNTVRRADGEHAARAAGHQVEGFFSPRDLRQDIACVDHQRIAARRRRHALGQPLEERHAKLAFKVGQPL
ncbi:hypothetical protein D3C81_1172490 [compost metagenome]